MVWRLTNIMFFSSLASNILCTSMWFFDSNSTLCTNSYHVIFVSRSVPLNHSKIMNKDESRRWIEVKYEIMMTTPYKGIPIMVVWAQNPWLHTPL